MVSDKAAPFEFETEPQQCPLPTTNTKPPVKKGKSSKSFSLSRKTLLKSLGIFFALAMLGFFIFLLVEFIRDKVDENNRNLETGDIELNTASDARNYFERKKQQNSLLISATWSSDYIALVFESTTEKVSLKRSIVSTFETNSDVWMASIIYMDATKQLFPFLGNSNFFDSVTSASNVVLNPNNLTPLTAEVTFTTPVQGKIKLTIAGRDASSHNLTHQFNDLATSHVVPVIGLYENYNNQITLAFTDTYGNVRASKQLSIQTGTALPDNYKITITQALDPSLGPKFTLIFYIFIARVVYDEQGYIRWYLKDSTNSLPPIGSTRDPWIFPLTQGLIAFYAAPLEVPDSQVYLANMLGKVSSSFYVPNGVHHEIIEKTQGGNLLVSTGLTPLAEEVIEEWDRQTLTVVKTWNLENYFDKNRKQCYVGSAPRKADDWMHFNSVEYDPKDNTLLISSRNQCFFGKIGYDDGKVKFIAGSHRDWNAPYSDYLLTPTNFNTSLDPDQDYTYYQHSAIMRTNGNYLIYDNGGDRPGFTNKPADEILSLIGQDYPKSVIYPTTEVPPGYARAVEYKVDYTKKTITKVWERADYPALSTSVWGSVKEINENLLLIGYGEIGVVSLVDRTSDTKIWGALTNWFYRAYPIDLYAGY